VLSDLGRTLHLDPVDWFWATWRPLDPLPRPAAAPFRREEALARLAGVTGDKYGWRWHWEKAALAPSLTREEAHFWLIAMTLVEVKVTIQDRVSRMSQQPCPGDIDLDKAREEIGVVLPWIRPEIMLPLAHLFSLSELFDLLLNPDQIPQPTRGYYGSTGEPVEQLFQSFQ
jgi:hypothetical protein